MVIFISMLSFIRPSVANIDIAVIIASVKNPNFDTTLLEKTLTIISYNKIEPIIYFTKLDLLNNEELQEINKYLEYYVLLDNLQILILHQ